MSNPRHFEESGGWILLRETETCALGQTYGLLSLISDSAQSQLLWRKAKGPCKLTAEAEVSE